MVNVKRKSWSFSNSLNSHQLLHAHIGWFEKFHIPIGDWIVGLIGGFIGANE